MENQIRTTSALIPISRHQRRYPSHDPTLQHLLALLNRPEPATIQISYSNLSIPEQDTANATEFTISIPENLPGSTTSGDDEALSEIRLPSAESASLNSQNQLESTTRAHHYSDIKKDAYILGAYLAFFGLVLTKLIREKDTPCLAGHPFLVISIVAYASAFLDLCILSWMYEHLDNPNLSHQNFYLAGYRLLKDVYYILCILAYFSLLPVLLTTYHQSQLPFPPPSPPHHHAYHH